MTASNPFFLRFLIIHPLPSNSRSSKPKDPGLSYPILYAQMFWS
jgi:hypothetical protein